MITAKLYETYAIAVGGREGHVKSEDGFIDFDLGKPEAMGGNGDSTNPESLFASGWAACFGSATALAASLAKVKPSGKIAVKVTVTLGTTAGKDFELAADIEVTIPGVTPEQAAGIAEKAATICPYSRATKGNIESHVTAKV